MVFLTGLAVLSGGIYLGNQLTAQQPAQNTPPPASPKVGMVNMAFVLKNYKKFQYYNDQIEGVRKRYEKTEKDLQAIMKQWQDYIDPTKQKDPVTQEMKDKATASMKDIKRRVDQNAEDYNTERSKKSDEQMVQMFKEVEDAIKAYAAPNGFHLIFHYSEPLNPADKYSPPNIQRKLVGPGGSGGVCPVYFADCMDVSADVVQRLNSMFPAPAAAASAPAPAGAQPTGNK